MNKRVVILGGGESGVGAAVLSKVKGFDTFLTDSGHLKDEYRNTLNEWKIPFEEGGHSEALVLNADLVIKSPGIPETAPLVKALRDRDISVISEIEFAGYYDTSRKISSTKKQVTTIILTND